MTHKYSHTADDSKSRSENLIIVTFAFVIIMRLIFLLVVFLIHKYVRKVYS